MNKIISFFKRGVESNFQALDMTSVGLAAGIIGAIIIVLYSALAYGTGYGIEVETFLESLLPGYSLSLSGTVVGVVWMFSLSYILGSLFAWIYNKLVEKARE
jgi:hypothetical protein